MRKHVFAAVRPAVPPLSGESTRNEERGEDAYTRISIHRVISVNRRVKPYEYEYTHARAFKPHHETHTNAEMHVSIERSMSIRDQFENYLVMVNHDQRRDQSEAQAIRVSLSCFKVHLHARENVASATITNFRSSEPLRYMNWSSRPRL
jgi:hypothetical protein